MADEMSWDFVGFQLHNQALKDAFAELLATFLFTTLGFCGNIRIFLEQKNFADLPFIYAWIWGVALTGALYVSGGVSGIHLNPVVTLGLASVGKVLWSRILPYFFAQYCGALLGVGTAYAVNYDAINFLIDSGQNVTLDMAANAFVVKPQVDVPMTAKFINQTICSTLFLLMINAVIDNRNMNCPQSLQPLIVGLIGFTSILYSFCYTAGTVANPLLDLAPRFLIWSIGWRPESFDLSNINDFIVPLAGCHVGGFFGSWIYRLMIEQHWSMEYDLPLFIPRSSDKYYSNNHKARRKLQPI